MEGFQYDWLNWEGLQSDWIPQLPAMPKVGRRQLSPLLAFFDLWPLVEPHLLATEKDGSIIKVDQQVSRQFCQCIVLFSWRTDAIRASQIYLSRRRCRPGCRAASGLSSGLWEEAVHGFGVLVDPSRIVRESRPSCDRNRTIACCRGGTGRWMEQADQLAAMGFDKQRHPPVTTHPNTQTEKPKSLDPKPRWASTRLRWASTSKGILLTLPTLEATRGQI